MWAPAAIITIAACLLFFSDQGLDLGVSLLGDPVDNLLKYFLLAIVLLYWAFASWHTARRSLDRQFPTFPAVRPDQAAFLPWLRWPPRLLGICAHIFAAINLSLAVKGYLSALAEPPHFNPTGLLPWVGPIIATSETQIPDIALVRTGVATLVTWAPVLIVVLAILLFWLHEGDEGAVHPAWSPYAHRSKWRRSEAFAVLGIALLVMAGFVFGTQGKEMPPGFLLATTSILCSAALFMLYVTKLRRRYKRTYEDQLNHDFYRLIETVFCLCFALAGGLICLVLVATRPLWFAHNVGSMVIAFFGFGAIISLINACDLPLDIFIWKARESLQLKRLWKEEEHRTDGAGSPSPDDDPETANAASDAFTTSYARIYAGLEDARIAARLRRGALPAAAGFAVLVAFGASQTHTFDQVRLCKDGACGNKSAGVLLDRPDIEQATLAWYDQAKFAWDKDQNHERGAPVPLVIVATAGGGIRAAYWTATALEALRDRFGGAGGDSLHRYLFAISSVSGGSLGAAAYTATLPEPSPSPPPVSSPDKPTKYLEADFLAPALASMLFHDTLSNAIPFLPGPDRGVALEEVFEEASGNKLAHPFLSFFPSAADFSYVNEPLNPAVEKSRGAWSARDEWRPILLLNATHQKTGRRIIQGHVLVNKDVFADAYDAIDLFGSDTPMSTAVMDSARFLYISPPGHLPTSRGGYDRGYIIDGRVLREFRRPDCART